MNNHCPFTSACSKKSTAYIESVKRGKKRKFLFLDRDGVINEDINTYILNENMLQIKPDSIIAMAEGYKKGWIINVCTNQPGISKGLMNHQDLDRIHLKIRMMVEKLGGMIGEFVYCIHSRQYECPFRKPNAGMLLHLANEFQMTEYEIKNAWFVGDHDRDYQASRAFGCRFAWIRNSLPNQVSDHGANNVYNGLYDFVCQL